MGIFMRNRARLCRMCTRSPPWGFPWEHPDPFSFEHVAHPKKREIAGRRGVVLDRAGAAAKRAQPGTPSA